MTKDEKAATLLAVATVVFVAAKYSMCYRLVRCRPQATSRTDKDKDSIHQ